MMGEDNRKRLFHGQNVLRGLLGDRYGIVLSPSKPDAQKQDNGQAGSQGHYPKRTETALTGRLFPVNLPSGTHIAQDGPYVVEISIVALAHILF